jgi:hypothetical protein
LAIRSAANNLCLDVHAYKYFNFAPVVMKACNGATNQLWQLKTLVGTLSSTHNTAKCLETKSGNLGGWALLQKKLLEHFIQDHLDSLLSFTCTHRLF